MFADIRDTDDVSFLRHWSERVYDQIQLAQIAAIEQKLTEYALTAWRPMNIAPPQDTLLLVAVDNEVMLLRLGTAGQWWTAAGALLKSRKPPQAWMPCPAPPGGNGKGGEI